MICVSRTCRRFRSLLQAHLMYQGCYWHGSTLWLAFFSINNSFSLSSYLPNHLSIKPISSLTEQRGTGTLSAIVTTQHSITLVSRLVAGIFLMLILFILSGLSAGLMLFLLDFSVDAFLSAVQTVFLVVVVFLMGMMFVGFGAEVVIYPFIRVIIYLWDQFVRIRNEGRQREHLEWRRPRHGSEPPQLGCTSSRYRRPKAIRRDSM